MVDRLDGTESHRHSRKFPEIRHEPRVRVGTQASSSLQLATKILQLLSWHAPFKKSSRVNARRRVSLEVNDISIAALGTGSQEVVERHFVQGCRRSVGRNVTANAFLQLVGADDHGQSVPADQALDAALHLLTSRKGRLLAGWNRVLVRSGGGERKIYARGTASMQRELLQQPSGAVGPAFRQHIVERVKPLPSFQYFRSVGLGLSHV